MLSMKRRSMKRRSMKRRAMGSKRKLNPQMKMWLMSLQEARRSGMVYNLKNPMFIKKAKSIYAKKLNKY